MSGKRLYVHIGVSKAGSSSIRSFLGANSRQMAALGYHCQSSEFMASHAWLRQPIEATLPLEYASLFRRMASWDAADDAAAYAADVEKFGRIEEPRIILTSQFFSMAPDPARLLADAGRESGVAILVARAQTTLVSALVRELLRVSDVTLEQARRYAMGYDLDYRAITERWSALPGFERCRAVPCRRGDDVVRGFVASLDLDPSDPRWLYLDPANVSLPGSVVHYLYRRKGDVPPPNWGGIMQFFLAHPTIRRLPGADIITPDQAEAVQRHYADSNAEFVARYPHMAAPMAEQLVSRPYDHAPEVDRYLDKIYAIAERAAAAPGAGH
jgi:hypothetical protein